MGIVASILMKTELYNARCTVNIRICTDMHDVYMYFKTLNFET